MARQQCTVVPVTECSSVPRPISTSMCFPVPQQQCFRLQINIYHYSPSSLLLHSHNQSCG
jgi:hypothetical protein